MVSRPLGDHGRDCEHERDGDGAPAPMRDGERAAAPDLHWPPTDGGREGSDGAWRAGGEDVASRSRGTRPRSR